MNLPPSPPDIPDPTRKMANTAITSIISRIDRRCKDRCITSYYHLNDDQTHNVSNAGPLLEKIGDRDFKNWLSKQPSGQKWYISEQWSSAV